MTRLLFKNKDQTVFSTLFVAIDSDDKMWQTPENQFASFKIDTPVTSDL